MNEETTLLSQLKKGSYNAFNSLYDKYFDLLYGFIYSLIRSHGRTREIVQETFIKVWINRESIDVNNTFKAWLYRIAKNMLIDEVRKQFHEPLFEDYLKYIADENLTVPANEGSFDLEVFRRSLKDAKTKLSPRQSEVFELIKETGLSTEEVSNKLNISEQAVYNYLSQAVKIIRNEMIGLGYLIFIFFIIR